mmetsp:Transcript_13606/g.27166  ORF Transcript_13606/g.27166 Transcript_13606/m.27166 type:complete len:230 (-) Transcript_13606:3929-4618(-)
MSDFTAASPPGTSAVTGACSATVSASKDRYPCHRTGDPPFSISGSVILKITVPPGFTWSFEGPDVMVAVGGTVSIHTRMGSWFETLPALSVAVTEICHSPSSKSNVHGDSQGFGAHCSLSSSICCPTSWMGTTWHVTLAMPDPCGPSSTVNVTVIVGSLVPCGYSKLTTGASRSTMKSKVVLLPRLPTGSVAATSRTYRPPVKFLNCTGPTQGAQSILSSVESIPTNLH